MRPICVPCRRFYRPKKNGTYFLEGHPTEEPEVFLALVTYEKGLRQP